MRGGLVSREEELTSIETGKYVTSMRNKHARLIRAKRTIGRLIMYGK